MAESSSTSSPSSSSSSSSTSSGSGQSSAPKQSIRASANDNVLEPDALRGNEQLIKQLGIQDDEQDRRDAHEKAQQK